MSNLEQVVRSVGRRDPLFVRIAKIEAAVRAATSARPELFRPKAIRGIALVFSVCGENMTDRELVTLSKFCTWICAFDDIVDEGKLTDAQLEMHIEQYERMLNWQDYPQLASDPVAQLLPEVLNELASAPMSRQLWSLFVSQLMTSLRAMQWERAAVAAMAQGQSLSLDEYLQHGTDSVFVECVLTAGLMMVGEPAMMSSIATIAAAQRHAATVVRIANDLASWRREQHEPCATNAMQFAGPSGMAILRMRSTLEMEHFASLVIELRQTLPQASMFIDHCTKSWAALYQRGDLDETTERRRWPKSTMELPTRGAVVAPPAQPSSEGPAALPITALRPRRTRPESNVQALHETLLRAHG